LGGTRLSDPLEILGEWNPKKGARPGLRLLMVSTTGEQYAYYVLDESLQPVQQELPQELKRSVELIDENCEPSLCTVMFVGGAGAVCGPGWPETRITDCP